MSIADELRKRVTEANTAAPAIQSAFETVVASMGDAADSSERSCPLIPLRPMLNAEQHKAVLNRLRAEGIEVIQHEGMGPMERSWTELKW